MNRSSESNSTSVVLQVATRTGSRCCVCLLRTCCIFNDNNKAKCLNITNSHWANASCRLTKRSSLVITRTVVCNRPCTTSCMCVAPWLSWRPYSVKCVNKVLPDILWRNEEKRFRKEVKRKSLDSIEYFVCLVTPWDLRCEIYASKRDLFKKVCYVPDTTRKSHKFMGVLCLMRITLLILILLPCKNQEEELTSEIRGKKLNFPKFCSY